MSPKPRLLASMLREKAGICEQVPVDVDQLVDHVGVEMGEIPLDGCLGVYIPPPDGPGILLQQGQWPGRRRFTLAHELGHFAVPTHARPGQLVCASDDLHTAATSSAIEREANEFAAELLMPRSHFGAAIRNRDPSFGLVRELASEPQFFVSRTAAARRVVELTREPCALVCSEANTVNWWEKSPNCSLYLERDRGDDISPDSVAAAVLAGDASNDEPEEVPPGTWFDVRGRRVNVLESTEVAPVW